MDPTDPTAEHWERFRKAVAALGDVNRLRIVRTLLGGPATVGGLTRKLGLRQPLVSHHLSVLSEAALVGVRREGRNRYYFLAHAESDLAGKLIGLISTMEVDEFRCSAAATPGSAPVAPPALAELLATPAPVPLPTSAVAPTPTRRLPREARSYGSSTPADEGPDDGDLEDFLL